tara:strand:+ start:93 stop:308 length:216 start_codon:yes stop_codon:yes gene_type:complete
VYHEAMKKVILIVAMGLLLSGNAYAEENVILHDCWYTPKDKAFQTWTINNEESYLNKTPPMNYKSCYYYEY